MRERLRTNLLEPLRTTLGICLAVSALLGCGDDDRPAATPDTGPGDTPDGGPIIVDAGTDTGPVLEDAGTDAGPIIEDAGTDGGPIIVDAGTDGGPPPLVFTMAERAIMATLSPLPTVPPDTTNTFADDPDAAAFGQLLFFDARYSGAIVEPSDLGMMGERGRVSCASCHSSLMMSDDRSDPPNVSLGTNFHTRNAPGIVNSAFYQWTNWGGRFSAQWELPPVVAENAAIMNSSRLQVAHHIFDNYRTEYEALFDPMEPALGTDLVRFPATGKPAAMGAPPGPWEMMTADDRNIVMRIFVNYGKAIQAYMRQIVSGNSAFDRFVAGEETALTEGEKRGLRLFMGSANCISCHNGPTFTDDSFHNLGIRQEGPHVPMSDDGRYRDIPGLLASTVNSASTTWSDDSAEGTRRLAGLTNPAPESVRGAFRTPGLRGIQHSAPFMHSGQLATLEEVIAWYDMGGPADGMPVSGTLDPLLLPLGLTAEERADLVDFLHALDGEPVPASLITPPAP